MNSPHPRHIRALEVLPRPVRDILRPDADLSEWSEFVVNTIEKAWANRRNATSLDEIPAGEILMCQRFLPEDVMQTLEVRAKAEMLAAVAPLTLKLIDDPWSLEHRERRDLSDAMTRCQADWLGRLEKLVEPPPIEDTFPAFLLETAPFASLKAFIGEATCLADLDTAVADELQRFVDRYRDYMVKSEAQKSKDREVLMAAAAKMLPGMNLV